MDDLQAPSFSCGVLTQTPRLINYGETKLKILALHWPSVARNGRSVTNKRVIANLVASRKKRRNLRDGSLRVLDCRKIAATPLLPWRLQLKIARTKKSFLFLFCTRI